VTDFTELFGFRSKSLQADDLNAKQPVLNSSLKTVRVEALGIMC
jgi:hypothetical protein